MIQGMRILEVLEPGRDGVFRHVEGLIKFLTASGYRVDMAYSSRRPSSELYALVEHVRASGGECIDLQVSNEIGFEDLKALWRLRSFVVKIKPALIHAHSSKAGGLVRLLPFLGVHIPIVYTPHAYFGMKGGRSWKVRLFNGIERILGKIGSTINVSEDEADFARNVLRISPRKINVILNGVETDLFEPGLQALKLAWKESLKIPSDSIVLGAMGRLAPQKDPMTLYRAMKVAMMDNANLFLLHVGQGPLEEQLKRFSQENGIQERILRQDIEAFPRDFFKRIDGFVLTSLYEGLSLSMLEALSADLPIIATNVPGNGIFSQLSLSHFWSVPPGEPEALAKAIGDLLQKRSLEFRSNHRRVAIDKFSIGDSNRKITSLYAAVVSAA
jgi:glycosyltransferase involved in cell wall biosynthesis